MKKNNFFASSWACSYEGVVALGDIGLGCGLGRGRLGNISIIQQGVVMELGVVLGNIAITRWGDGENVAILSTNSRRGNVINASKMAKN